MAMDSNVEIELVGNYGGQVCFTQLEFHRPSAASFAQSSAAAQAAYAQIWDVLRDAVVEAFQLVEIRARIRQTPTSLSSPEFILPVNEYGTVESDGMPPFVTAVMVKIPDNTTKDPVGALDFKPGRASFSGVAEIHQDQGLLNAAGIAVWEPVAQIIESITFDVSGTPTTWNLGLERGEVNPDKCYIDNCYARQSLGTQNTRKR